MLRLMLGLVALALALPLITGAADAQTTPVSVTIQPGDVIRVEIWREEELSGEFPIDEEGYVVLPLIGERQVAGMAMRELRTVLIAEFREHLRNPSINIVPLRRVNVLGEVGKPGMYLLDPTISLAGAIAMAEGVTGGGDMNRIRILRSGEVLRERVAAGSTLQAEDVRSGDQIIVDRRSWFERNSTFLVSTALSLPGIILSVILLAGALN